jgi:hypothetical protein
MIRDGAQVNSFSELFLLAIAAHFPEIAGQYPAGEVEVPGPQGH